MKRIIAILSVFATLSCFAQQRETIWPKGKMPHASDSQIAAMTDESGRKVSIPGSIAQPILNGSKHLHRKLPTAAA
jgi:hypothetical protein